MQRFPIQLGPVGLREFEVPSAIKFGGQQRLAVHRLYGGSRSVEPLGPDPTDIQFDGVFTGPDAAARFRVLDALRLTADVIWLSWDAFRYAVIVQTLHADYRNPWWIGFNVRCTVATDLPVEVSQVAAIAAAISSDLSQAGALAPIAGVDLTPLQTIIQMPNAMNEGTSAQVAARASAFSLLSEIGTVVTEQSQVASALNTSISPPGTFATTFNMTVNAAGQLAAAVVTQGYVARVAAELGGMQA